MIPESESKPGLLESELESELHDAGIGSKIRIIVLGIGITNTGIRFGIGIKDTGIIYNFGDISMKIKQEEYVFCEIYCKHVLYYCSGTNQGNHMRNRSSDHYFL